MSQKKFIPCTHPLYDSWIFMQNCKLREEQRTKEQYEKLCERFREELVDMQKRDPIELKDKAEQRTFYCEVKQFNDSKAKDEYLNNPNLLPMHLCNPIFKHTSVHFFKRIFQNFEIIRTNAYNKKSIDHIDDQISWNDNSVFELYLFHGSQRFIHYFDEEFLIKQLINCLIVLHKGGTPDKKIINAFTLSKKNGMTTLRIRI